MASIGKVLLALGLDNKELNGSLTKAENQLANSINNMKTILIGAQLGRYLFSGAEQQAREELKMVQTAMSAISEGFSQEMIDNLQPIIDQIDFLGVSADQAADTLYKFVLTGRALGLQQMGIYLSKDTQSMLTAMSAAERYQWALSNLPNEITKVQDALSPTTKAFYEFQKRADDIKKSLGTSFLSILVKIIDTFGGLTNTMKTAIIAFTAYKTAMILGNVGIGISKAIAQGGVFAAPIAIGMGAAALASITALIGGASLAISALNGVPSTNTQQTQDNAATVTDNLNNAANVNVTITNDRYGQMEQVKEKSNGVITNTQSKFGV